MINSPLVGFHSGSVERDGSIGRIWMDDVTGDGREDAVILVRSGGAGSYVVLIVLEGTPMVRLRIFLHPHHKNTAPSAEGAGLKSMIDAQLLAAAKKERKTTEAEKGCGGGLWNSS